MKARYTYPFVHAMAIALIALLLSLFSTTALAQSGSNMYDAIPVSIDCSGGYLFDVKYTGNGGYSSYNWGSGGPWYTFTLGANAPVIVSTCGSNYDTQVIILNEYGYPVASNSDNGPSCWGTSASVQSFLPAGTYYVVAQGESYATGFIYVDIYIPNISGGAVGSSLSSAIDLGTFSAVGSASDTRDNQDQCLGNATVQGGAKIFYKFAITTPLLVSLSHCSSELDTYLQLLDVNGQSMASNDNNGPSCAGVQASIGLLLQPGTYYVVSEGREGGPGGITTEISVAQPGIRGSSDQNYVTTYVNKDQNNTSAAQVIAGSLDPQKVNTSIAYFDGLGRPLQNVQVFGSPMMKDMVTPMAYDIYDRENVKYLPYAAAAGANGTYRTTGISDQLSFYSGQSGGSGIPQTSSPFSVTVFEKSELDRPVQQGFPGAAWQPTSSPGTEHTTRLVYGTNDLDDANATTGHSVRLFRAEVGGQSHHRVLSSNGHYSVGQLQLTILKDENWQEAHGKAGTVEEYKDKEGKIVLKRLFNDKNGIIEVLSTYYVYDDFGHLSFVLTPGANPDAGVPNGVALDNYCYQYRYDNIARLIEKRIPGKEGWDEVIYNPMDRVVFTQDPVQRVAKVRSFIKYDALGRTIMTGIEIGHIDDRANVQGTVNTLSPLWDARDSGANHFHGYDNLSCPSFLPNLQPQIVNYYDDYAIPGLPYQPSGYSTMLKGLPTASKVKVLGSADQWLWKVYCYDQEGRVVRTWSQHHLGGIDITDDTYNFAGELTASIRSHHKDGVSTTIATNHGYDHMGRPSTTHHSINGAAAVKLSEQMYNEVGQLREKKLHNGMQSTSYAYNERGWLKSNSSNEFSMALTYNDGAFPQYNGNISGQSYTNGTTNNFSYSYDRLNRLLSGTSNGLSENLTYDVMGNIASLKRDNGSANTYHYNGNRLASIDNVAGSYGYDLNGNATTDGRTGVTLSYNHLNLPQTASKAGLNLAYTYDAMGRKLKKVSNTSGTTDYVDGIQYTNGNIDFIQTWEGIARKNGDSYSYEYNLSDHLGNVRTSFDIYNNAVRILQRDDYYAFGMRKSGLNGNGAVSLNNKYLYNSKELQDELEQYDYGARFYDPVIARWNVVDPLAEMDRKTTPYAYVFNNPMIFIDPDGMFGDYYNNDGKWLGTDGKDDNKAYVAKEGSYKKNEKGYTIAKSGITELGIGHDALVEKAATVYGESSAYKTNGMPDELKKEMFAIASVHEKNDLAYGNKSESADAFRDASPGERNGTKKQFAVAAEINAQLKGPDYSNGASQWDGREQGLYPATNNKKSTGKYELHMNTMGWSISDDHYSKWKNAIGKNFVAPQTKAATVGMNKGNIRLTSSAVYMQTIFWKVN